MKTVNIKGKEYIEVNERLKYFRSEKKYEGYSLESEVISLENGVITIKAIIKDANGVVKATGLAQEKESSSFINKTSFVENCETSAWGRALGNLGIGIDTSIASAEEVQNAIENQQNAVEPKKQYKKTTEKSVELPQPLSEYETDMNIISTLDDLKAYASGIKEFINKNKDLNKLYWTRYNEILEDEKLEAKRKTDAA